MLASYLPSENPDRRIATFTLGGGRPAQTLRFASITWRKTSNI